jgi:predicted GNAT family acetyltransferase
MNDLPEKLFANPVWHALQTKHSHFAVSDGDACRYPGVRSDGELIAIGGERLTLDGSPEISGICAHPAHRDRGLAAALIWHLVRNHRRAGLVSWLHVSAENHYAIELYLRMGFVIAARSSSIASAATIEMQHG